MIHQYNGKDCPVNIIKLWIFSWQQTAPGNHISPWSQGTVVTEVEGKSLVLVVTCSCIPSSCNGWNLPFPRCFSSDGNVSSGSLPECSVFMERKACQFLCWNKGGRKTFSSLSLGISPLCFPIVMISWNPGQIQQRSNFGHINNFSVKNKWGGWDSTWRRNCRRKMWCRCIIISERGRRAQRDGSHHSQCRHWDLTWK